MPSQSTRLSFCILFALLLIALPVVGQGSGVVVGPNVNMVTGSTFPDGDPFQRQQNEPSVAFSSRNNLHLLAGANDYRAVDVPGLPGGRETGDSWLSYFWSTNGGATWKSTLIPGYPQDPDCDGGSSEPTLCGYAAGADPVVRAGANGMFYYSGIVFERGDMSRSAIFVSRFIDLNNDEGGDPIRFIDTVILDSNDDGAVFLDKSWIGVDVPRAPEAMEPPQKTFMDIEQRGGTYVVDQTVECGNLYVGYAAISGEGQDLLSEIRLATSTDCGDNWSIEPISQLNTLNQGANIGIDPVTGDLHVVWRRFDTFESFLGIPASGCPSDPASWEVAETWPTSNLTLGGVTYTREEALDILRTKHKGDESIKLAYEVIAAKLNLLTGGGDPAPGFNPQQWAQQLSGYIAQADAWFMDHPIGSDPKQGAKKDGQNIKKDIQEILLGSGTCSGGGAGIPGSTTGATNAILIASSYDGGQTFTDPDVIDESSTFDQGSTTFSFRTTAYPTVTVDASGRIYVAWAARGFASVRDDATEGDARIVISTSEDGSYWEDPYPIDDDPDGAGHQIKPSLLFAGGQLTLVYYDFRQDASGIFDRYVIDIPEPDRLRHTVDVRVATAAPAEAPAFTNYDLLNDPEKTSTQASRYTFLADAGNNETVQAEYMPPNLPMFADGTTPFIGDYVDVAAPNLIFEEGTGWRFAYGPGEVQVWQAVWADNRDVIPPPDGDWAKYVAPTAGGPSIFDPLVTLPDCNLVTFPDSPTGQQAGSLYTGTRNQNVYSATISRGLIVAAPGNNRPLVLDVSGQPLKRGFVVYVLNTTNQERTYQLTVGAPAGVVASFDASFSQLTKQVVIPPFSSAAETVYASLAGTGTPTTEAVPVMVEDLTSGGSLGGTVVLNNDSAAPAPLDLTLLQAEVHNPAILNPAILNPAILNASVSDPSLCTSNPDICVLNPAILNPAILNPAILNPAILNPAILNPAIFNPAILNPAIFNPAIFNPAILNPAILNPAILNPAIFNPAIFNPAILNPAILNPAILNPAILNPAILNPAILNPAILNPAILNATTTSDTRQVDVTFAVKNEGNATTAYNLNLDAPQLAGLDYELMVYRLNETPVTDGCELTTEAQQQLILNQSNPATNPLDGTFYLEPGQEVLVTFRVLPDVSTPGVTPADPVTTFDVSTLGGQATSQPTNTDGTPMPPDDTFGTITPSYASLWNGDGDALDSLGGNDGTLQGGAGFADGRSGQSFSFTNPAGGQYVQVADDPSLQATTAVTMTAWIYPTSGGAGNDPIVINKEGEYEIARRADGRIEWAFAGPSPSDYAWVIGAPAGSTPLNTWTHVAVTYDNGTVITYVNGAPVSTFSRPSPIGDFFPTLNELWIGSRQSAPYRGWFVGRIDEVGIQNTALTATEVLDLYNEAPPFIISSFDPSVVFSGTSPAQEAALNAAVGVTGYTIEDFEDLTLVPGLTVTGGEYGLSSQSTFPDTVWDSTSYYVDRTQVSALNFNIAGGTSSFGIGMGDIDNPNVRLYVNDQDFGYIMDLPNWVKLGDNVRDVYVRVDAAPGESITDVRIEQGGGFNDGIFFDHVAFATPSFVETVITSDLDILNDGALVAAHDLGAFPSAVTVNGIPFGTDQSGLGGPWGPGGGDFSVDPFSAGLDALLSDLQYSGTLSPVTFTVGSLTPGTRYRLQLLFSNDLNTTGDRVDVTIDGETWFLDDWQNDAVNLTYEFTANGTSLVTTFEPGVGSTGESGRAVLNAWVLHDLDAPPGPTITGVLPNPVASNQNAGLSGSGFTSPLPAGTTVTVEPFGGGLVNATVWDAEPDKIGFRMPPGLADGPATVTVNSPDFGTYQETVTIVNPPTPAGTPLIKEFFPGGIGDPCSGGNPINQGTPTTTAGAGQWLGMNGFGLTTVEIEVSNNPGIAVPVVTSPGCSFGGQSQGYVFPFQIPTGTVFGTVDVRVRDLTGGTPSAWSAAVTLTVPVVEVVIVSTLTEPIRPGTGYIAMDFDPSSTLPADWQTRGWSLLADDGSVFGPQNIWGLDGGTRFVFRPFSTRLPAGPDVPGSLVFTDSLGTPVSNHFPVTFSQTPGAPVIEAVYTVADPPGFCGGTGPSGVVPVADGASAPAGSWLAVDVSGVDTSPGGVAVFNGVDVADCGLTSGGINSSLKKYVQVPAGIPAGPYTLEWRAGIGAFLGPVSNTRTLTN